MHAGFGSGSCEGASLVLAMMELMWMPYIAGQCIFSQITYDSRSTFKLLQNNRASQPFEKKKQQKITVTIS
jgi:hypothetical protein